MWFSEQNTPPTKKPVSKVIEWEDLEKTGIDLWMIQ